MPIKVQSRRVAPGVTRQPTQPTQVQTGAPLIGALQAVGETASDLGRVGAQIQQIDAKEEARLKKLIDAEQVKSDKAEATRLETEYRGASDVLLTGYLSTSQGNAKGTLAKHDADHTLLAQKIIGNGSNDTVKALLAQNIGGRRVVSRNTAMKHEAAEGKKERVSDYTAASELSVQDGIRAVATAQTDVNGKYTPRSYNDAIATLALEEEEIEEQSRSMQVELGWGKDQRDNWSNKQVAMMYDESLRHIAGQDAGSGQFFLDTFTDKFTADQLDTHKELVNAGRTAQDSRSAVIDLREKYPNDLNKQIDVAEKDSSLSPEASTATITQLRQRSKDDENAKKADNVALNDKVTGNVDDLIKSGDFAGALIATENAPTNEMARAQKNYVKGQEAKLEGGDIETDKNVYAEAWEGINNGTIRNVADINGISDRLSQSHYDKLVTALQSKLRSGVTKDGAIGYETAKKAYQEAKRKKYNVTSTEQNNEFLFVREKLDQEAKVLGRDLSPTEASKLTRKWIVEGEELSGSLFKADPDKSRIEATQDGTLDRWVPDINDNNIDKGAEKIQIDEALKAKGIKNITETMRRLYKKDAILDIPLSDMQIQLWNDVVNKANAGVGPFKPIPRNR